MKKKYGLPLLAALGILLLGSALIFGAGRFAASRWHTAAVEAAPTVTDTAAEQVENELKAYPYQILTLSAAEILYKEVAQAAPLLTPRENDEGCISAAQAAALAGNFAATLYDSDLSEKTLDLLPVNWRSNTNDRHFELWIAAYTLSEASQTAPDGNDSPGATQGCWLFCLNAADGSLLYSHCTASGRLPGSSVLVRTNATIPDEDMFALYRSTLALADALGLSPTGFCAAQSIHIDRGLVRHCWLRLNSGLLCEMIYDTYYQPGGLYSIKIADASVFDEVPEAFSWVELPLTLPETPQLTSAVRLAALKGSGEAGQAQSSSYSAANDRYAYLSNYYDFSGRDFILCRIDPVTATRSLLCEEESCRHTPDSPVPCAARTPLLTELTAGETDVCQIINRNESNGYGIITSAVVKDGKSYFTRSTEQGYRLTAGDPVLSTQETFAELPSPMKLFGWIGDCLLLYQERRGTQVVMTEAGLQPRDAGARFAYYIYDLSKNEQLLLQEDDAALACIYDGNANEKNLPDVKNGRLWLVRHTEDGIRMDCLDLFTGEALADVPSILLPDTTGDTSLTNCRGAGRYLLMRTYGCIGDSPAYRGPRFYIADTATGEAKTLPWADSYNVLELIAVFGDEALIQQTTAARHRYYFLSLSELFDGSVTRRWVTDDFVLG